LKVKKRLVGIKSRVFIVFFSFALLMVLVLWLYQTVFLSSFYEAIRLKAIKNASREIEGKIGNENLYTYLSSIARSEECCIIIAEPTGVCYSVDVLADCVIHRIPGYNFLYFYNLAEKNDREYLLRLKMDQSGKISDEYSVNKEYEDRGIAETIIYTRIVSVDDREYCIILNAVLEPISATVSTLRVQLIQITVLLMVISCGLAIVLSRSLSKPLIKLTAKSKLLGKPSSDGDFVVGGYKEVYELGETLTHAAAELKKTDSLQKELVANISHDLRTPLTMIAGYAEIMRDIPGENSAENAEIILNEAKRLSTIVTDVLDISRLQAGTEPMVPEAFDISKDMAETCQRFIHLTEREGYQITCQATEDAVLVYADRLMISRVIYNLINNAVTHTGESKEIDVSEKIHDGKVRISIADKGPGIPESEMDSIWERYYKVDKQHKRNAVGSGLGLSIVKTILSMHKATYGVSSSEGIGSEFWFELPIIK